MRDRFKNKYRIESTRLKNWDYGWNAPYFVTICTQNREFFFGKVVNNEMMLNDIGLIAEDCWLQIPKHFPFVKLGDFVVMPNHVHGIVVIDKTDDGRDDRRNDGRDDDDVEARLIAPLHHHHHQQQLPPNPKPGGITGDKNPMLHENLSKIIRWFKGRTTFESRKFKPEFAWQPRFHDHIIRNEKSYQRISEYIRNKPLNWSEDQFFK